jgi:hypothetical protein
MRSGSWCSAPTLPWRICLSGSQTGTWIEKARSARQLADDVFIVRAMQIIKGRICKFLNDSAGEVYGFSLDIARDVYFPSDQAARVLATVSVGSRVLIRTSALENVAGVTCANAVHVVNLDSGHSLIFLPQRRTVRRCR